VSFPENYCAMAPESFLPIRVRSSAVRVVGAVSISALPGLTAESDTGWGGGDGNDLTGA
jgi:hypothetical protein